MPVNPPKVITLACTPRSPENLKRVIDELRLETEPKYQPEVFPGVGRRTKCNYAAEDFLEAMGLHIPKRMLARRQIQWLKSSAGLGEGWLVNTRKMADLFADQGLPVLVCWINPNPDISSHIAFMRSAGRIAQAGVTNFSDGPIKRGFGTRALEFYVHQ